MFTVGPSFFGAKLKGPVQFVGAAHTSGAVTSIPAHQAGDLIILISGNVSPAIPDAISGFTQGLIYLVEAYNEGRRVQWKRDLTNSISSVSNPANALYTMVLVYRNATGIGAAVQTSGGPGKSLTIPALTLQDGSGASWVVGVAATNQATTQATVATGLTLRDQKAGSYGGGSMALFDTAAPAASFAGSTYDWSAFASAYYTPMALEILQG